MRNTIFAGLALAALSAAVPAAAAPAPALLLEPPTTLASLAAQSGRVQVWMDGNRDLYRPGERMHVRVRSDQDGYLAVFHIDTNGDVDIIYPRSENEEGWIEGGRTLNLGSRGGYDYVRSRGGYGLGYVMAVTLDEPLELWRVRELYGVRTAGWDGNRSIFGDPFYAMDELVRAIVPEGAYGYESVDYATYHVGQRRYRYPRYACYDGYGDWYNYRGVYWDDCDRVRILLVSYPWYYDTHRWRGPRRVYYERYYYRTASTRPLHRYKERTDSYAPPARGGYSQRPAPASRPTGGSGGYDRPGSATDRTGSAERPGTARRPQPAGRDGTMDRPSGGGDRASGGGSVNRRPDRGGTATGSVRGGTGRAEPRSAPADRPTRGTTRPQQQDEAAPRQQDPPVQPSRDRPTFQRRPPSDGGSRTEPRRESPPQRSAEPRRESPPARSVEPRRESPPPQRQAEPRRESPPARQAQPRRESPPPSRSAEPRSSSDGGSRSSAPRSRTP